MGLTKKSDGRYVVGKGIADGNEYKGSAAWRDIVIQYSGDGATEKSLEYLTFLKDYALYHSAQGNPVIPPNVQIWMSTANTMKAVEADDITVDGETVKIGACTWHGSDWSFAEPTPGGGGSSLPPYTSADKGKVLTLGDGSESETVVVVPEQTVTVDDVEATLLNVDTSGFAVGVIATMSVNGTDYSVTAEEDSGAIVFPATDKDHEYVIFYDGETAVFTPDAPGTYTVSLTASVPVVEPKWEAAGLFVTANYVNDGFIIDSNYATILSAIESGINVIIAAKPEDYKTLYFQPMKKLEDGDPLVFTNIEPIITGSPASLEGLSVCYLEIYPDNSVDLSVVEGSFA